MEEKKVDKKELIKNIAACVGGAGVWEICKNVVNHTTPSGAGFIAKTLVLIGSTVLTGMLKDKSTEYLDGKVDEVFDFFDSKKEESEEELEAEEE